MYDRRKEAPVPKKNQLDPSNRFDRTLTCDRQADTDRHGVIASTRANVALRG